MGLPRRLEPLSVAAEPTDVREALATTPVVLASGRGRGQEGAQSIRVGGRRYVVQIVPTAVLVAMVEAIPRRHTVLPLGEIGPYECGDLVVDRLESAVTVAGNPRASPRPSASCCPTSPRVLGGRRPTPSAQARGERRPPGWAAACSAGSSRPCATTRRCRQGPVLHVHGARRRDVASQSPEGVSPHERWNAAEGHVPVLRGGEDPAIGHRIRKGSRIVTAPVCAYAARTLLPPTSFQGRLLDPSMDDQAPVYRRLHPALFGSPAATNRSYENSRLSMIQYTRNSFA